MDKFFSYQVFLSLAQTRSFTQTAALLNLSQPTVSRVIAALEKELDAKLLARTTKTLELTAQGEYLVRELKPVLDSLTIVEDQVVQKKMQHKGTIKFTVPQFFESTFYPIIAAFLLKHPQIKIDLIVTNEYLDLDYAGIDLALRIFSVNHSVKLKSALIFPIAKRQLLFVASPDYLKKNGTPQHPCELKHHNCLIFSPSYPIEEWGYQEAGKVCKIAVSGTLKSTVMLPILEAAILGLGVAVLPHYFLRKSLEQKRLVTILNSFIPSVHDISLVQTQGHTAPFIVKELVAFIKKEAAAVFLDFSPSS